MTLCVVERVGVREVRQNISAYLRRVERGEAFTVTERGRPVAVLAPVPPTDDPLAELVARGAAEPPKPPWSLPSPAPAGAGERPLNDLLRELRDEEPR